MHAPYTRKVLHFKFDRAPDIHDIDRLIRDALNGKQQGFGAKLCVHPKQIEAVHRCYRPREKDLNWAARVIEAAANDQAGAITLDGKMIDRPVLLRAQQLLALDASVRWKANRLADEAL
jgi:citrate lyase subunit beta/citryl-CoA lyase